MNYTRNGVRYTETNLSALTSPTYVLQYINHKDLVFGGGLGYRKNAMAMALNALYKEEVKIILCRPAVEAGENWAFPGRLG